MSANAVDTFDMGDLRRTITDAALLVAAAIIYSRSPQLDDDPADSVDDAAALLRYVRESVR